MKASGELAVDMNAPTRSVDTVPFIRLAGLAIVALFPALFWTALIGLVSNLIGYSLSYVVLAVIGAAIALFLTAVYAAITSGSDKS
jgi:hypothetical protein